MKGVELRDSNPDLRCHRQIAA